MKRSMSAATVFVGMVFVGMSFGTCPGWGQAKRPMTFADLMAMKRVSDPQISPSGKWVLFSVTEVSLEKNTKVNHLWVVPLGGGGQKPEAGPSATLRDDKGRDDKGRDDKGRERQLTFGGGESNGRFSPDGKFVSLSLAGQVAVSQWDEATGRMQPPVTLSRVSGGADGAIWSPDSKRLLFVASVYPECSDKPAWKDEDACDQAKDAAAAANPVKAQLFTGLLYRHWDHFTGLKRSHVLVMEADGSGIRDLTPRSVVGDAETPTFSLGGPLGYAWAPDCHEIAYVTNLDPVPAASTNNDVFTLRLDETGAKAVKVSTSLGSDDGPQYSPDGKWLAFRSQKRAGYESDRFRLMLFDRQAKTAKEAKAYLNAPQGTTYDGWVDEFVWTADSNEILFTSSYEGAEPVFSIDFGILRGKGMEPEFLRDTLGGEYSDLQVLTTQERNRDGKVLPKSTLIAMRMNAAAPAEVVMNSMSGLGKVFDVISDETILKPVRGDGTKPLTHLNDNVLRDLDMEPLEQYWFGGAEGVKVEGFIVRPPNFDSKKKYPVKFLIHGGPQGAWGDAWSYRWNAELMAASGYVVVMVNPRGSTGYGQAFIDGVNGDWGGKAYSDLMKGLDAAEQQFPFIDKTRECALGASYGGFMANWILTHTNRFQCIVTHDGMFNPAAAYGDTDELWFNEWEFRRTRDYPQGTKAGSPGQPWRYAAGPEADDPFRRWSPMLHIQDAKTPTLVIHSQKDYRLDVSEGYQLFTALQRLGVPSEMLYFPDEGHWILKPQNSELWYKTVGDWCDRWTKTGKD